MGNRHAVLVDPPLTIAQATEVGDWVESSGRRLRRIYVTHGHGDHWFGAIPLLQRFPDAVVHATKDAAKLSATQNSAEFRAEFWDQVFPNQLPSGGIDVDVMNQRGFGLQGAQMLPVEAGRD